MEKHNNNDEVVAVATRPTSMPSTGLWQRESLLPSLVSNGSIEVSIYDGERASVAQIREATRLLGIAFPQMSAEFWGLLGKKIAEKRISAKRLAYAVDEVVTNYTYQRLTIADIIGEKTDKRYRLMTYSQMLAESGGTTDGYCAIKVRGLDKPAWVSKADKARYQIPDEL